MARTYTLTDGTTSVSLIDTAGVMGVKTGFRHGALQRKHFTVDDPVNMGRVVEDLSLNLYGTSHDDAASKWRTLSGLLRKAARYQADPRQQVPVYLTVQTTGETSARYALCFGLLNVTLPDEFDFPFEGNSWMTGIALQLVREHPWRSGVPGTLPTALTLTATDGPASPTTVHLSNYRDDVAITHVYTYDASGASFSSNLVGTNHALFPASTAVDDILYIGSTTAPLHTIVIPIGTAGSYVATPIVEIYTGSWVALTAGTEFTCYPIALAADTLFGTTGDWVINVFGKASWASVAINSITAWWVRIRLNPFTSMATIPACNPAIYHQKTPHFEIPSTALTGDMPALMMLRAKTPAGAGTDECPAVTSRFLFGAKSRNIGSNEFVSHLNCGNAGNPTPWATTYGTDTSASTTSGWPFARGAFANCTFSTDATLITRVTLTGTAMLAKWLGAYRVFLSTLQSGGAAGDCSVRLRAWVAGTTGGQSKFDTPAVYTKVASPTFPELMDLGPLKLPFSETMVNDSLGADLILQVMAARTSGAATLGIGSLILLPTDEWTGMADDPIADTGTGNSGLRGLCQLDIDGGVVLPRTVKYQIVSGTAYPAETWHRGGELPTLEPGLATRIYVVQLYYPTTWGTGPLLIAPGEHCALAVYAHSRYSDLRGAA